MMGVPLSLLLPLIPGLVSSVISLVDAITSHGETPEATKAHLQKISDELKAINERVQATPLP